MHPATRKAALLLAALALAAGAPALAQAPPAPVKAVGREPVLNFGGLLQVQGEAGDSGDSRWGTAGDRFFLRRARLKATARFLEEFDVQVEGEFSGSLLPAAAQRAQLTDAYINWNRYPGANIRVGQFKTPFGFEQLYLDPRLPLAERALVSDRLSLSRQIGVQVAGDFADKRYGYALGIFNGNSTNVSSNDDNRFATVGRAWMRLLRGRLGGLDASWTAGVGAYTSHDTSASIPDFGIDLTPGTPDRDGLFSGKRRGLGLDTQVALGPVELWVEYFETRFEPANSYPRSSFDAEGGSALVTWSIVPNRWQLVARYEQFDPLDFADGDDTQTTTLGVNWLIKGHDLKLMADLLEVDALQRETGYRLLVRMQAIF